MGFYGIASAFNVILSTVKISRCIHIGTSSMHYAIVDCWKITWIAEIWIVLLNLKTFPWSWLRRTICQPTLANSQSDWFSKKAILRWKFGGSVQLANSAYSLSTCSFFVTWDLSSIEYSHHSRTRLRFLLFKIQLKYLLYFPS